MKKTFLTAGLLLTAMTAVAYGQHGGQERNPNQSRDERQRERRREAHDVLASIGTKEITAAPANVTSGTPVRLDWRVLARDPDIPVQGNVEIHYSGLNSGKWSNLPKVGSRQACPLGDTTYSLKIASGQLLQLDAVRVGAPCPSSTITQEQLQAVLDFLGADVVSFDSSIRVKSLAAAIVPGGISLTLKGEKRVRQFPNVDIKADLLAMPRVAGAAYTAEIRKFGVSIGSVETRLAWDVITAGSYEIAKAALEAYFEGRYKRTARQNIEDRLNTLLPRLPAGALPQIKLQGGSMSVAVCAACQ